MDSALPRREHLGILGLVGLGASLGLLLDHGLERAAFVVQSKNAVVLLKREGGLGHCGQVAEGREAGRCQDSQAEAWELYRPGFSGAVKVCEDQVACACYRACVPRAGSSSAASWAQADTRGEGASSG